MEKIPGMGSYYLYKDRIYKVSSVSRSTDEILICDIETGERYTVRLALFSYAYEQVWKVGVVAKMLGRSSRSIYRYETRGVIEKPKLYASKGGRLLRFYTKADVFDIHELISGLHQGRPRKDRRVINNGVPSRLELLTIFRRL